MKSNLIFRNTVLETMFQNKQIWFMSSELAKALQYSSSKSVSPKTDERYTNSTPFKHNLLIFICSKSHLAWAQRKIGGGIFWSQIGLSCDSFFYVRFFNLLIFKHFILYIAF
ncbi:hypothetical protein BA171_01150 [Candidatus Hamiltonella defensa (Bemisia tabaci)]|uniref:Bro-N domain-containing protein n=1 Tax=Candidatus Hamiltonella defensa (Bemisia tabaci) TaxID=672795 RepID=A0A249DW75_9ENTR|nr:hypothetical protein BA171_01150 [Candidatus Hamiltonella defensa (Bemisia tabaci)]